MSYKYYTTVDEVSEETDSVVLKQISTFAFTKMYILFTLAYFFMLLLYYQIK